MQLENLLNLINQQARIKQQMAEEAARIVYDNTQKLKGVNTNPPEVIAEILENEDARLAKPAEAIETGVAQVLTQSPTPIFSYENDSAFEDELFSSIAISTNEIRLPPRIIIQRSKYLRPYPIKFEGWFSYDKELSDDGYDMDYGGIHDVNYVIARLTGFHKLQKDVNNKSQLMYTQGRDVLLTSAFLSIEEIFKNNKRILDDILQ